MPEEGARFREKMSSLVLGRKGMEQVVVKPPPPVGPSALFYDRGNAPRTMHNHKETDKSNEQDQPIDFSRKSPSATSFVSNINRDPSRDSDNSESSASSIISLEPRNSKIEGYHNPRDEPVTTRSLEKAIESDSHPLRRAPTSPPLKPTLTPMEHEYHSQYGRFLQHTASEQQMFNPRIPYLVNDAINRTEIVSPTKTMANGSTDSCQLAGSCDNPPKATEKRHNAFTINNLCSHPEASQNGERNGYHPRKRFRKHLENPLFAKAIPENPRSDSHIQDNDISAPLPWSSPSPRPFEEEPQQAQINLAHPQNVELLHHPANGKRSDTSKQFTKYPNVAVDGAVYGHPSPMNSALGHYSAMFPYVQPPLMSFAALQNASLSMRLGIMPEMNGVEGFPQDMAGQNTKKRLFQTIKPNEIARLLEMPDSTPHVSSTVLASEFPRMGRHSRRNSDESSSGNEAQESDIAPDSQGKPNDLSPGSSGNSNELYTLPPGASGHCNRRRAHKLPEEMKDRAYYEKRRKNNAAAKRSRDTRRQKEDQLAFLVTQSVSRYNELKDELNKLQCIYLAQLEENNQLKRQLYSRSIIEIQSQSGPSPSPKINGNDDHQN